MASKVFDFVDTLQSIHTIHAYCKFKFVGVFEAVWLLSLNTSVQCLNTEH